jgi:glycerophosphoryl diester phosphodiesterase
MLKIGHRGAKGYRLENTLASFQKAIELDVDGIELDVHLSTNNQVMVIHDTTINRTTTEDGLVSDLTSEKMEQLGIPTLTEVIALVDQKCFINIEIKDKKATPFVLSIIENFILEKGYTYSSFLISSFDWTVLEEIVSQNPEILLGVLTDENTITACEFAIKINAYAIHPSYKLIDKETVALWQQKGFKVFPWTVNTEEDINLVKKLNVDGIISDFPDRI